MSKVTINNIVSSYGKKRVLDDVNMSAESGQCIGIVGMNGCGKSTFLNILAGLRRPDSGEIFIGLGKSLEENTGYVPQDSILLEELTVIDNLSLWYSDHKELRQSLESGLLKELGVDTMCRLKVSTLSGGMKKRVSIGCALANNPLVLILDEPAAALDLSGKSDIRNYIQTFKSKGGVVFIATHEESDLEICDKVYVLCNGKSKQIDTSLRGEDLVNAIY